jgi:hypothetical protein
MIKQSLTVIALAISVVALTVAGASAATATDVVNVGHQSPAPLPNASPTPDVHPGGGNAMVRESHRPYESLVAVHIGGGYED